MRRHAPFAIRHFNPHFAIHIPKGFLLHRTCRKLCPLYTFNRAQRCGAPVRQNGSVMRSVSRVVTRGVVVGVLACASVGSAGAQGLATASGQGSAAAAELNHPPRAGEATLAAVRLAQAPKLDGDVVNDPVWQGVEGTTALWQVQPDENAPVSEKTDVRVAFTNDTLYFGVICYDRDPGGITSADSRRDSSLEDTDSFTIVLDTYHDGQNAFLFGTSPSGLEYDGQVSNEGRGASPFGNSGLTQQSGSGGGFNLNWDGAWTVRTRVSEIGWTAEIAIPFRTLRYPATNPQTWGANFQRNIRRRNEQSFWTPIGRGYNIYRMSVAGTLTGVEAHAPRTATLTPYVLGESVRTARHASDSNGDLGVDAKVGITPSLALDATYNTDFAQVEVDEQQVNLDRFTLFFPEKRPFFLENAGLFSIGTASEIELFFSRRIGISDAGQTIPIRGGGRLSGRVGPASVGVLDMQTESVTGVPSNNFGVFRVLRELPNRTAFGAMIVNRQGSGDNARPDDYNRTFIFDGRLAAGRRSLFSGFLARTVTPGTTTNQAAGKIGYRYELSSVQVEGNVTKLGEGFNPEVGFLARRGYTKADVAFYSRVRPGGRYHLQELRPHASYKAFWNPDGFQETGYAHIDNHWVLLSSHEIHTGINLTREGVTKAFAISPGVIVPPGTYDHKEAQINLLSNQGAPASIRLETIAGGFFGGTRVSLRPIVRLRTGQKFNTELNWQRVDVRLPGGKFVTNVARMRLSYSFTPRIFAQTLAQYNNTTGTMNTNLRFGWLQAANTGLFVVWNDTEATDAFGRPSEGRSFTIKYSRQIDLGR